MTHPRLELLQNIIMELHLSLFLLFSIAVTQVGGETSNGALRLVRDNHYSTIQAWSSGIVEIYYDDTWGNICDDALFGYSEANVLCQQLAFTGVSSYGNSGQISLYGTDVNSMVIEDVSCSTSNYLVLLQCDVSSQYSTYCNNNNRDAVVTCYSTRIWNNPYTGQIRLTGGEYSNEGLLEIYCNGQWGTVCDDTFSVFDAFVACEQLGYNDYNNYGHLSITGETQPIWFDDVQCGVTTFYCLTDCQSCPSAEDHDCFHFEDVTLDCQTSSLFIDLDITGGYCNVSDFDTFSSSASSISTTTSSNQNIISTISTTTSSVSSISSRPIPTGEPGSDSDTFSSSASSISTTTSSNQNIFSTISTTTYIISTTTSSVSSISSRPIPTGEPGSVSASTGVIIGSVVAAVFIGICILVFTVPFCICCCLRGGGICTSSNHEYKPRTTVVAIPNAMYTKNTNDTGVTEENETCNIGSAPYHTQYPAYINCEPQPAAYHNTNTYQPHYPVEYPGANMYQPDYPVEYPTVSYLPQPGQGYPEYPPQQEYPAQQGYPAY